MRMDNKTLSQSFDDFDLLDRGAGLTMIIDLIDLDEL